MKNSIEKENKKVQWYDNPNIIVYLMFLVIGLIVTCSQSFAKSGGISLALFGSIINHNSIYLLVLIYFILLKTKFGKKFFNYMNIILIFIYLITSVTSLLTVVQMFSLNTLLSFFLNFMLLIYMSHTFLRGTRLWNEFKLSKSLFNEFDNNFYFYSIIACGSILLIVNFISTVVIRGVVISTLDYLYLLLLTKYIYLYHDYLDVKKIDVVDKGDK